MGVPISSDTHNTASASPGRSNCSPSSGAISTSGNPDTSQCEITLPMTRTTSGSPASSICSSVPSWWSGANSRASDSMQASSAATHSTPGAMLRNWLASGPTPSGNRLTTMTKKTSALTTSPLRRNASSRSRRSTHPSALIMRPAALRHARRDPRAVRHAPRPVLPDG